MSTAPPTEPDPRRPRRLASSDRLAELVVHLIDCSPEQAIAALEAVQTCDADADAALEVVARAMCAIRRVDLRDDPVDLGERRSQRTPIA